MVAREARLTTTHKDDLMLSSQVSYLTAAQAATRIGTGIEFIYDACAARGLKHIRLGGKRNIRIKASQLDEWMTQFETENV
jgi:excisionase family DNA binding protein